jgi:phage tail sheath protein FI
MPVTPTYPGVYIEEVPSGVRTITGVATSITAFIGRALRGPVNKPIRIQSFAEYERIFGSLWIDSTMSYAVQQFFLNGGSDALIVRIIHSGDADTAKNAAKASVNIGGLDLEAENEGAWANHLKATIDHETKDPSDDKLFNLTIEELEGTATTDNVVASEVFRNVSTDTASARYVKNVLENQSEWVRTGTNIPTLRPNTGEDMLAGGDDGDELVYGDYEGSQDDRTGLYALEEADLFNLMCIPPFTRDKDVASTTWDAALQYCKNRRAMLIVDPPNPSTGWSKPSQVTTDSQAGTGLFTLRDENAVIYYPRVKMADSLQENRLEEFVPCGVVAGIFARTDAQRGVWKAPAGLDATLSGVRELSYRMTDGENGQLNPIGVNCLRTFPVVGNVVWGARTMDGADLLASQWKYLPVRRLALYIEESLYRGTQWVVFEPNDEPLWAQIRLNLGTFMHALFRQGAFQGKTPREAYFVKCDKETTTQNDVNQGIVNILVGFAPLKPAEFVIIKIQQIAGQIET